MASENEELSDSDMDIDELEQKRLALSKRLFWLAIAGFCLMILSLLGVATTTLFVIKQRDAIAATEQFVICQREANAAFVASLQERSEAADQDRTALKLLASSGSLAIGVILDPARSQQEKIAAISAWQLDQQNANIQLQDAENKRKEHPLAEPQKC